MSWSQDFRRDVSRYTEYAGGGPWRQLLTQQGLWALLQYRIAHAVATAELPHLVRRPLLVLLVVWQKMIEITTGISLPYSADLGAGLHIGHLGPVVINGAARVGCGCNLAQGVTLGVSGRGAQRGVPVLGDRVWVGPHATISGAVTVGSDAVVGANSLVINDVPPSTTVLGVPATVVGQRGSADYLAPSLTVGRSSAEADQEPPA